MQVRMFRSERRNDRLRGGCSLCFKPILLQHPFYLLQRPFCKQSASAPVSLECFRTSLLLAVSLLGETYPSELAQVLGVRLYTVQSILADFEREGIVVSRLFGRTRRVALNPRYFAQKELGALLSKLGKQDAVLQQSLSARRRRPRRVGKPGLR
jgi:hypothetical protein